MPMKPVDADDLPALSILACQTFSETFGHLYPPEDLKAFLEQSYSPAALAVEIAEADQFWRIIYDGPTAIGYVQATPVGLPHPEAVGATQGELKRLYVLESAQGRGLGKALLEAALEHLSARYPDQPQWIGVWSDNYKAQALYKSYGFEKVGEYGFPVGDTIDREYILKR